jgi:uncharacterized protein YkwD
MSRNLPSRAAVLSTLAVAGVLASACAVAAPRGAPCDVPGMREIILQQVNEARARGATCGSRRFGAAAPVSWNGQLFKAAAGHSRDMAENNYFSHNSLRGTEAFQRAEAAGYKWKTVGENIAAGTTYTVDNVVHGWLKSPAHCNNIMDPDYNEIAVACIANGGSTYGSYWTMVLGRQ